MTYFLTFLEGFASFISPCILPLVPMYISYFTGNEEKNTKKAFINALFFVLGLSLIFILMAIFASTVGIFVSQHIKYIKIFLGVLVIILGLSYLEIIKFKLFKNSSNFKFDVSKMNIFRSFIFGILFSISHAPCVGAFLSSALMLITKEQNLIKGIILMSLYSIGLGIPFIISALIIDKAKELFKFVKNHYRIVKIISGVLLIVSGIYLIFF